MNRVPLTPAERNALIARAKQLAVPVASCVAARVSPARLIGAASRDELAALVVVLAEAADPVKLRTVAAAGEDDPDVTDIDLLLRQAHAQRMALYRAGVPVPEKIRRLDSAYTKRRRMRKQQRKEAA
jgi:hypothetical protein